MVKNEAGQVRGRICVRGDSRKLLIKQQSGLVPSNYLTIVEGDDAGAAPPAAPVAAAAEPAAPQGATATALYDYEAGEDNELSFPENATITNVVSPASAIIILSPY